MTIIINKKLSQKIEHCIQHSHVSVTNVYKAMNEVADYLSIGGGVACFSGCDSFLSQVVGWGFNTEPELITRELSQIENFYQAFDHNVVDIELSPLVGEQVIAILTENGYGVTEANNISLLSLSDYQVLHHQHSARIAITDELSLWSNCVAEGFDCLSLSRHFKRYAQAESVYAFAAFINGNIAAGATCAIENEICDLGVTSTLPNYRNLGLQKALLHNRLMFAKNQGLSIATVTTEPGSISDLNIQKIGFKCAYTRMKFSKKLVSH